MLDWIHWAPFIFEHCLTALETFLIPHIFLYYLHTFKKDSPDRFGEVCRQCLSLLTNSYEQQGKFRRQVKAQKLWFAILEAQVETGTPYMLYKDACNRKSNQQVGLSP